MSGKEYIQKVQEVLRQNGWEESPALLLEKWSSFVSECEEGYNWEIEEYWNEIRVRNWIEALLSAPELKEFEEFKEFTARVEEIDSMFRGLLLPDVSLKKNEGNWWEEGVLRYAGETLARDLQSMYGIQIEVVD